MGIDVLGQQMTLLPVLQSPPHNRALGGYCQRDVHKRMCRETQPYPGSKLVIFVSIWQRLLAGGRVLLRYLVLMCVNRQSLWN